MIDIQFTQTTHSDKGIPVFERVRELIAQMRLPVISQEIIKIEAPLIGTGSSALSVPQIDLLYVRQLDLLQQWYLFRNERTKILYFFERYPFLVPLLVEAFPIIGEFFPYSLVYLTVSEDPEEFGVEQLIVFIATDLGPDDALDALSDFDKKWWLSSLRQAQGKLCITLEFR